MRKAAEASQEVKQMAARVAKIGGEPSHDKQPSGSQVQPRIIYIRFCSKLAVLLHRITNQNIEAKMKSRSWKPLAIYREKPEAYTEGAIWKAPPFWKNGEKKCHRIASRCWNIASIKVRESVSTFPKVSFLLIERINFLRFIFWSTRL